MQCIATNFLLGHNDSYVESMGSKLKHHNKQNRDLLLKSLEDEVIISWNGPKIQHADKLIKETIDSMHGAGQWHFVRTSTAARLKFYRVSEAVDRLQNIDSTYFLD